MSGGHLVEDLTHQGELADGGQNFWLDPKVPLARFIKRLGRSLGSGDELAAAELADSIGEWPGKEQEIKEAVDRALPFCESPIERIFLPWLLTRHYRPFEFRPIVLLPGEGAKLLYGQIALIPQMPLGRFRADFVLAGKGREFVRFFIIECDGADYHEDKERDEARDKQIRRENKRVKDIIRVTGGDIMNRPRDCAEMVCDRVMRDYQYG